MPSAGVSVRNTLPGVGSVVLAVVRRVRARQVDVGIVVVYGGGEGSVGEVGAGGMGMGEGEGSVCADEWPAVLRREDVRATEKEKVLCGEGFRVGDVVRGVVVCSFLWGFLRNWFVFGGWRGIGLMWSA